MDVGRGVAEMVLGLVFLLTIPGVVIGLVAVAAVDRMGLWAHRRWRVPWRRDEQGRGERRGAAAQ
ncbi:hypothetical protein GCM10010411_57740 [Actinomadura fulvescens]|uniref:Uncharacterized protein n=1 Tax=Actinomadura fulvescens TaxID=46160 RepID=A0ABN3Q3H0_9ACTN